MSLADYLIEQNKIIAKLLESLDVASGAEWITPAKLNFCRLRWSMVLEENELLLKKLAEGVPEYKLDTYVRVFREGIGGNSG